MSPAERLPQVTVVIGANGPPERLEHCLGALESQREGVDVRVHADREVPSTVRERFPWATFATAPGTLVPEHWRDGIDAATGEIVALTISAMIPAPDWIATLRRLHEQHDAVGGAIEPGRGLRLVDWGEYFCRYAREMRPFPARATHDVAGDNAAYKRALLERVRDSYREGFWEPVAHRRLVEDGASLWHDPALVVYQGRSAGFRAFARQRLAHGRLYGHQRGVHFSRARNLVGVLAAPLVPALMVARALREVFRRGRHRGRAVLALPVMLAFDVVWAYAEARGHADMLVRR